jgi:hypothetical protein
MTSILLSTSFRRFQTNKLVQINSDVRRFDLPIFATSRLLNSFSNWVFNTWGMFSDVGGRPTAANSSAIFGLVVLLVRVNSQKIIK